MHIIVPSVIFSVRPEDQGLLTPRHLLHEYLNVAVLGNRAQVLNDIAVLEVLVQGYLLVQRLGEPRRKNKATVICQIPGARGPHHTSPGPALLLATPSFWKCSLPWFL